MKNEKSYQGRIVDVVEVKGGWSTILDGMKQLKVRNSELSTPVAQSAVPAKPGPVRSAKSAKKAEKAKREPKPAAPAPADNPDRLVTPNLERYVVSAEVKTPSGRKAIDINDEVAASLRGSTLDEVYKAASGHTGVGVTELTERYKHLNPGMQRMNLGNLIRGAMSKAAREEAKAASKKA